MFGEWGIKFLNIAKKTCSPLCVGSVCFNSKFVFNLLSLLRLYDHRCDVHGD